MAGTSFTPKRGIQHQITPPTTSVNDSNMNSAAGKYFDPILKSINPDATKEPCKILRRIFLAGIVRFSEKINIIMTENKAQVTPDIMIVVNLGVSGCHLKVTAKVANEIEQNNPKIHPKKVPDCQSL